MCGIIGYIGDKNATSIIVEGLKRLEYRGYDSAGIAILQHGHIEVRRSVGKLVNLEQTLQHEHLIGNVGIGHTRWATHGKPSEPNAHPHRSGNVVIVHNGIIENYLTLRQQLKNEGYHFESETDTEVILALYSQHGPSCVTLLRGMFAFAIWDATQKRLFVARDRLGEKPFNYALVNGQFLFASEIRPLAMHPLVGQETDIEALELFLELQYVPAPWTIFKQIRKLLPAHYAIYDRNGLKVERYWQLDYRQKRKMSETDAVDALEEKLRDAVKTRLLADVPLGATLSGGSLQPDVRLSFHQDHISRNK